MTKSKVSTQPRAGKRRRIAPQARQVTAPSAGGAIRRMRIPKIVQNQERMIINHCEPILNPPGGAAGIFASTSTSLIPAAFPWLSGVAANFSRFKWHSLELVYIPVVPTSAPGEMAMGLIYDRQDTSPTTITQVETLFHSVSTPVWGGYEGSPLLSMDRALHSCPGAVCLSVDIPRLDYNYYKFVTLAAFNALGANDQNLYAPATIFAATLGAGSTATQGRIYGRYRVELVDPIPSALQV